jgi:hypothetical protein
MREKIRVLCRETDTRQKVEVYKGTHLQEDPFCTDRHTDRHIEGCERIVREN